MFNPFYTPVKNIYMYYIYSYERKRRENKKSRRKDRHFIRKDFNYFSGGYSSPLNPSIHRDWLDDKDKNWISKIKEKKKRGGGGGRGKLDRDEEWKNFYSNDFTSVTHFCNGKISNLDLTIQLLMEYSGTRSHFSTRNPFHPPALISPCSGNWLQVQLDTFQAFCAETFVHLRYNQTVGYFSLSVTYPAQLPGESLVKSDRGRFERKFLDFLLFFFFFFFVVVADERSSLTRGPNI